MALFYLIGAIGFTVFIAFDNPLLCVIGAVVGSFPTGCMYGIILQYFEGRIHTDAYIIALNFVVAFGSSAARVCGRWGLSFVSKPLTMPIAVVLCSVPLAFCGIFLLNSIPPPSIHDQQAKSVRKPMSASEQWKYLMRFLAGFLGVNVVYTVAMSLRAYRDTFAVDIYSNILQRDPTTFDYLSADILGGVGATLALLYLLRLKKNRCSVCWWSVAQNRFHHRTGIHCCYWGRYFHCHCPIFWIIV
eukprot:m.179917 g.179917  ORF g.179917 m.179917 type:complete len:245 (-) comp13571_c0_seq19:2538-3272(-)